MVTTTDTVTTTIVRKVEVEVSTDEAFNAIRRLANAPADATVEVCGYDYEDTPNGFLVVTLITSEGVETSTPITVGAADHE